jgi:hypothetical protein
MPAAPARPHTDAVVAALQAAGLLVGRGEDPPGAGWQGEPGASVFKGYAVLFPTPGIPDGDLADPNEYLDYTFQATCVAATQDGAEAVADAVKTALVGRKLAVTGRYAYPVYLTLARPVSRDDKVKPVVHYAVIQLGFRTGPA